MDPVLNPYAPGAGTPPPELSGREELREKVRVALERVRRGRPAKSVLMVGLRGVGKTVLLDRMREDAESTGIQTIRIEAPEDRSLPAILAPQLRLALLKLSRNEQAREVVGEAARKAKTALILFVDELQYVQEEELAALIVALHRAAQRRLPVTLVGAGLPQLRGRMGRAKSYAERLFDFPEIGPLPPPAAKLAISKPARDEGVELETEALDRIVRETHGYPYFLQEWGKHVWDTAERSPISSNDVEVASESAIAALDESFFRVRFDRLTPIEKKYLRAMAELGPGPHRSGDIADQLNRRVTSLGPTRNNLISKGMVWSPSHGDTAFTVPLFDEFMVRIMPADDWRD